ncbi:winged helix DNA-binding domain-containing protein [Kribbella alba]|uniref:Winged helix DNA-binding domain-containing protein n=1 Tax=Kribbella alba TaxID=190197 RepID=A0ABP4QVT7_9ACTN
MQVTWEQALAWRMTRHFLVRRAAPAELVDVTARICGLHAQVRSSPELSLWARIDGLDADAVRQALWKRRTLVKLWAARGTLYLLPARELSLWLSALSAMPKFGNTSEPDELARAVDQALRGRELTREELAAEVERRTGSQELAGFVRSSWGSYLKAASFQGLICFAGSDGAQVRFTSPATWVRTAINHREPEQAVRDITRRFLTAYGPATPADLGRWWLGPPAPRRTARMLASLAEETTQVDVDGTKALVLTDDLDELRSAQPLEVTRLLPAFDPWVIGAARHSPLMPSGDVRRIFRPQGWVSPTLLVDGRIAGVWRHERKGQRLVVELEPFGRLAARARQGLEAEAERLAGFLSGQLDVNWS